MLAVRISCRRLLAPLVIASLLVVAACTTSGGHDVADAGPGSDGATGDADVARTDFVPAVGKPETLDIACWNLREYPLDVTTARVFGDVVASLDVDLVTVEEIFSKPEFDGAVARLPGWKSALPAGEGTANGGIGLLWRSAVLELSKIDVLFAQDARFVRPVIRAAFDVIGAKTPTHLVFYLVHHKAGTGSAEEQQRINEVTALEAVVRAQVDASADDDDNVMILGDFNEDSDDNRSDEVFAPWLGAPDRYRMISHDLDVGGAVSFLPGSVMLDQMVITNALVDELGSETPFIPPLHQQVDGYREVLSDHLPLVVRLGIPRTE